MSARKLPSKIRTFKTGATRDADDGKLDYEAFLSPLALRAFAQYMHQHRLQPDGKLRPGDNWQRGIPIDAYMKSQWRHHVDCWLLHRGHKITDPKTGQPVTMKDALCAVIFNAFGHLHELLKNEN